MDTLLELLKLDWSQVARVGGLVVVAAGLVLGSWLCWAAGGGFGGGGIWVVSRAREEQGEQPEMVGQ